MTRTLQKSLEDCRYVALHVTDYCNLQCTYCFESAPAMPKKNTPSRRFMDMDMAVGSVQKILEQSRATHLDILLFGGEPLLIGMDWLEQACDAFRTSARDLGKTVKIAMTTNGTAVTPDVAKRLKAANIGTCVSIDGPPEIHDLSRGGSKALMRGLDAFQNVGTQINAICVVNPSNVDHIEEILEFLQDQGVKKGRFTPMTYAGNALKGCEFSDINTPIRAIVQVLEHMLETKGKGFIDLPLMRRIAHFAAQKTGLSTVQKDYDCYTKTCWAGAGYLAVSGDGALHPCSRCIEPRFQLGHIDDDGAKSVQTELEDLHSIGLEAFHCESCAARVICFGGCAAHNKADDRNFALDCALTRALFDVMEARSADVIALHRVLNDQKSSDETPPAQDSEALRLMDMMQKMELSPVFAKHGGLILSNGSQNYLIDPVNGEACAVTDEGVTHLINGS